ncbi:MAG: class I SAM-dependent methyltransferase [Acidobacteriota bacterium]
MRRLVTLPFLLMGSTVRRRLAQAIFHAAGGRAPGEALSELLGMEADLDGQVNEAALAYGEGVHVKHRIMRYHDFFVDRLSRDDRVLDIGCGYGAVAHSMAARGGAYVVALDMDPANIAKAASRFAHERITFLVGEAPRDVPAERFDVVVISNVLEHIDGRVAFLRAVQQRVGATRWLVRVPLFNRDWRPTLRRELGLFAYSDPTHFTEYTTETFEDEMEEAGFSVGHLQVNWGEIWAEVRPRG